MDHFIPVIVSSVVSGCIVGLVMLVVKVNFEKMAQKADEANELKITHLTGQISDVKKEVGDVKFALMDISKNVTATDRKMSNLSVEHKFLVDRVSEVSSDVKLIFQKVNFGKVVRKD